MEKEYDDVSQLKSLGSNETEYIYQGPSKEMLEVFPNKHKGSRYAVDLAFPEFTSLCPKTGQPDFATIRTRYIPRNLCLESKSIKLYFFAYRNFGAFMESITNKILRDFVNACDPVAMEVEGIFASRGALAINVKARFDEDDGYNFSKEEWLNELCC